MARDDGQINGPANRLEMTVRAQPLEGQRSVHEEARHIDRIRQGHAGGDQHGAINGVFRQVADVLVEKRHFRQLGMFLVQARMGHIAQQAVDATRLPFPAQPIFILAPD
jgi:hypothetical protein